ncbi:MAG: 1-acyl-sn-glycerol-3-phosphate acyltransferase [Myxococcales bacterium]|nr:1-acyl-sn-glycerol-3-phosphate acyltransferase [Myxococcales bacterium]
MVVDQRRMSRRDVLSRWLRASSDVEHGMDPAERDPAHVARVKRRLDRLYGPGRYFRVNATGWEHLPSEGAFVISNHSGGAMVLDGMGFAWAWTDHWGVERPLYGMCHDLLFANRFSGRFFGQMGALRARRQAATAVLGSGRDLLVFPGGDQDTWRPWGERYTVNFAGRTGYARLALRLGVPVTPMAHAGAHHSFVVLTKGRSLARAVGMQRFARSEVFPIHLSLPWGLAVGPLPHIPLPVRLDYQFGPVVPFPEGFSPTSEVTDPLVQAYDARVRAAVQGLLDDLRAKRRGFLQRVCAGVWG